PAFLLLCSALFAAGCGGADDRSDGGSAENAIVRVGDARLTEEAIDALLPSEERTPLSLEDKKRFVERWIETEILYQEALRRGVREDPRVRARIRALEQEFLADHLAFLELRERTAVTEREIEAYFESHEQEYRYEYRVSHILVSTLEEAENVLELLKKNSFEWVANRHSIDPVARRGGDLGYLSKGNMIPEFESAVFELEPGEVSGIVKSDFGYHIIKLVGMRESLVPVDPADVRAQILNMLIMEKRDKAYDDFLASLRRNAEIEYLDRRYEPGGPPEREAADTLENEADSIGIDPDPAEGADTTWGEQR
ncbi:MAG TPA: peptidylprolyl isomerase, partial [Candidatus Eisenbacteria bacterium]|nr:peptidylprolyl isomerase [Candidatus Eisenbacteria bacterium]